MIDRSKRNIRIGIDLGGSKIEACALADNGNILWRQRIATPPHDYRGTLTAIKGLIDSLEIELNSKGSIGIGTPGSISPSRGVMHNANSTCLNAKPLLRDLQNLLQRPVRIANDADCFALSEATDGAGEGAKSVFGVIIGTGTGGGLVYRGELITGPNGVAGEWGHNPLPWPSTEELPGPDCYCGKSGCIETFLSGPGLVQDYPVSADPPFSAKDIAEKANHGDPLAIATLQRHTHRLARGLASVINLFDPEIIVLGGGLSNLPNLYEKIPEIWKEYVFSDAVTTRLMPPVHGDSSGVRGAAWLWPKVESDLVDSA